MRGPRFSVLGIESSCDETAAAVVDQDGRVISDVVASQVAVHAPYGGVVPELASRAHLAQIVPVIDRALAAIPGGIEAIDGIAVTRGPGLPGALLVGLSTAKAIAFSRDLPLVYVDHLIAHLLAVYLRRDGEDGEVPEMPFVALLASGGHTAIYEVRAPEDVELIGQTRDDAAGEAFDKAAKLLGLGYPGGPVIDRLARRGDPDRFALPLPMPGIDRLDFSFSGLKTALARRIEREGAPTDPQGLADVCAAVQHAIVEVLARKSVAACRKRGASRLVLAGGVAANSGLRARVTALAARAGIRVHVPPIASCTDNAAMIAYAGLPRLRRGERDPLDLQAYARSPDLKRGKIRG